MNRYDVASVAKFSPLSFNELAAAPTMMRQKHDNSIAAAEALRIKANPLDKHLSRALEIKNQMDAEIAKNVDTLNKEGYNPTTFQNITKLNRQYQDMISPTGEIGQINNAKIVYDKAQEDFIQDAAKQNIGRGRALDLWKEKTNYYTGFGEDGKSITNVSPQGVAAYQDYEKYKQVAKSLMGEVESESRSGNYKLVPSSLNNGTMVMVDSKGFQKKSTNLDALNNAILSGSEMWLKPTGEGYKYNQDAGVDQNNFKQRFIGDFGSMLKTSTGSGYEENGQFINDASGPGGGSNPPGGGIFGEDYNTKEVGGKNQDYSDLEKIGKTFGNTGSVGSPFLMGTDTSGFVKQKSGKFTSEEIKDPRQKILYENAFKNATTGKGIMLDGKLVHLSKDMQKFGKDDPRVAAQILRSIKQNPAITLTSKLLTTNQVLNDQGFVAGLGTTADDVDKNIRRQLQMTNNEGRKLIDPKTGKTVTFNEIADEYGVESINDVNYQGQISAHNWEEDHDKLGSNSRFSPHVVTIKTKDGWKTFKTTRLSSDNIGGNPARQNDLTKNYRNATVNYGDFVDFESSSNNLKGIQVKYNPNEQEYDSRTGEPKTWTIKFKNGAEEKATESQYMNWVNSIK